MPAAEAERPLELDSPLQELEQRPPAQERLCRALLRQCRSRPQLFPIRSDDGDGGVRDDEAHDGNGGVRHGRDVRYGVRHGLAVQTQTLPLPQLQALLLSSCSC